MHGEHTVRYDDGELKKHPLWDMHWKLECTGDAYCNGKHVPPHRVPPSISPSATLDGAACASKVTPRCAEVGTGALASPDASPVATSEKKRSQPAEGVSRDLLDAPREKRARVESAAPAAVSTPNVVQTHKQMSISGFFAMR